MRNDAYLNGQNFNNFLLTPSEMEFTEKGFAIVEATNYNPKNIEYVPFNYALQCNHMDKGIHFYIQDYLFDRVWNNPRRYTELLKKYSVVIGPDFSLYWDTPEPIQMWSFYKKQWLERYWQIHGVNVIPNITWSDEDSFKWCFEGVPKDSVISISANGCMKNPMSRAMFWKGYIKAQEVLKPRLILLHCAKGFEEDIEKETKYPAQLVRYNFRHVS